MKIYLHIGLEKTGTTSIQQFLTYKREELIQQNILYPKSLYLPNNEYISVAFRDSRYVDDLRVKHNIIRHDQILNFRNKIKESLKQEIDKYHPDILIISNEHISSRLSDEEERKNLINFLKNFSNDITVIVYLRRQDKLLESLYSTSIISGNTYSFEKFFQQIKNRHDLHFYTLLKQWGKYVPKEKMIVKKFDKFSLFNNDIVDDFIKTLNLNIRKDKTFKDNTSLGYKKLEFLRRFNRYMPMIKDKKINFFRGNIINLLKQINIENDFKIKMTKSQIIKLMQLYNEENMKVSKEFFGSKENIFAFNLDDVQTDHKVSEDEYFEIFSKLWEKRQIEMEKIKVKNMILNANNLILKNNFELANDILKKIKSLPYITELKLNNEIKNLEKKLLNKH